MKKNELWYIVQSSKESQVIAGFKNNLTKGEFVKLLKNNQIVERLNYIDINEGDAIYIPSGIIHSILQNVLILEIQQNSNITYRVFDLDGTLWDTSKEIEQVWKNVAQNYDIKVNEDIIKKIMGYTKNEIIEYLFKGNNNKGNEFITKCQEKENEYLIKNGGHIFKNTLESIKKLSLNYDLYIVSNCQSGYIEAFLKYYDVEKYFKDYESSGNTGFSKEKNIKTVLERNNILKAVYVGDTIKDYESAEMNGLPFVWAEYGFGKCDKFYKKIKDICELINLEI